MFVIAKSKKPSPTEITYKELAESLRKSQYAAVMAMNDPLLMGKSPGQKLKWQKKCLDEMRRVNRWLEDNNEKIEEFSTIEFVDNETIEEWSKRIRNGTETILPGL
jgi:hypothetical protein